MAARKKMIFDEAALHHLRACHAQGMLLAEAAKEFGVKHETLSNYIHDSPYVEEVRKMYPCFGVNKQQDLPERGIQRISLELLKKKPARVPNNPQARALARSWRSAA